MRSRFPFVLILSIFAFTSVACAAVIRTPTPPDQRHGPPVKRGAVVFVGGYFYDPFFGAYPWWSRAAYPYRYHPVLDERAEVRVLVTPADAAVYVDGYYAGVVDDFDGILQRLP